MIRWLKNKILRHYKYQNKDVKYIGKCHKKDLYIVKYVNTGKVIKIQKHLLEKGK